MTTPAVRGRGAVRRRRLLGRGAPTSAGGGRNRWRGGRAGKAKGGGGAAGEGGGLDQYDRVALVAQHIQETKIVRPLDLSHSRLESRDCLGREKVMSPPLLAFSPALFRLVRLELKSVHIRS